MEAIMNYNKYFITTAIPYINAKAHVGHAQEFLLADSFKQTLKAQGKEVLLQSGTDDNSLKNVIAAQKKHLSVREYIQAEGIKFQILIQKLNVQADYFVHTSSKNHHHSVDFFIRNLNKNDIYEGEYEGLYCVGCEDFLKEQDLKNGLCPDHLNAPIKIKEKNIFFNLSKYQKQIHDLIDSDTLKIYPASRKKEILQFINQGLSDISISRPIKGEKWGIDFPDHPGHTVYVWIDALVNYLTGIGYGEGEGWQKSWNESYKIHVIGKNVWKFHAIYWVGLLLSANILPPNEIVIHGFLTNEGVKISKSLGNAIDPLDLINNYEPDVIRAYLLGKLNYLDDSDFKQKYLDIFYTQELVNQIGNLFPRLYSISNTLGEKIVRNRKAVSQDFRDCKSTYNSILSEAQSLNKDINDSLLWKKEITPEVRDIIQKWSIRLNHISDHLEILFPSKIEKISKAFEEKIILFPKK